MAKRTASARGFNLPGRRLFDAVTSEFELSEHELSLLREVAHVADILAELQRQVDTDGLMQQVRFESSGKGPAMRPHPALSELRAQRVVFAKLIAALGLPRGIVEATQPHSQRHRPLSGMA